MFQVLLLEVVDYLEGKFDLYDGRHNGAVKVWDNAWDEMRTLGYNPETAAGIRAYIRVQL